MGRSAVTRGLVFLLTFASLVLASGVGVVQAADVPMYDQSTSRTRTIVDPTFDPTTLYLSAPIYVGLPGNSVSTPTVVGNTLYQYVYRGGTGTLYALKVPQVDAATILRRYGFALPRYLSMPAQVVHKLVIRPSEGSYGADAQDSLSTSQGWQSIAIGRHVYSWPEGQWPASQSAVPVVAKILGNPGNWHFQVDMNPLITPPVPVRVFSMATLRTTTISLPTAVACNWSGGCIVQPLGLPKGDIPTQPIWYWTTQTYASDGSAAITSDPVFVPSEPLFNGQPAVAFGVASQEHPRIELLDLATGASRSIGVGQVATPIADSGMLVSGQGGQPLLVYHDSVDDIYAWNLNGKLVGVHPSGSTTISMGVDGSLTYPAFTGSMASVLQPTKDATQVAVVPIPSAKSNASGAYIDLVGASSPTTVEGSASGTSAPWCRASGSPADWCRYVTALSYQGTSNGGGPGIMLLSGATGGSAYVHNSAVSDAGQLLSAKVSQYIGALLDAGPGHYIISWSNSTAIGPALEMWVPVKYGVTAEATPTTVPSGSPVTISARPVPAGVTSARLPWHPCNTGQSPVTVNLSSNLGNSGYLNLTRTVAPTVADPWSTWSVSYRLPPNTTGRPVTWSGTVTSTDKFCSSASASISFVEEPGSAPAPVSGGTGLVLNPNPALWGQWVNATLTPLAPSAPSLGAGDRLLSWSWQIAPGATLSYPAKNKAAWAVALPALPVGQVTIPMSVSGHQATTRFMENFWDGGCHTPVAGACVGIVNLLSRGVPALPGVAYDWNNPIPARQWPVKANYALSVSVTYETSRQSCVTDSKTGKQTCTTVWSAPISRTYDVPQTPAQATLTTDGTSIDVVGGG